MDVKQHIINLLNSGNRGSNVYEFIKVIDQVYGTIKKMDKSNLDLIKQYLEMIYTPFLEVDLASCRTCVNSLYDYLMKNYSEEDLANIHSCLDAEFILKVFDETGLLFSFDKRVQKIVQEEMQDFDVEQELLRCKNDYWGTNIGYSHKFHRICLCPNLLERIVDFDPYQYSNLVDCEKPMSKTLVDNEKLAVAAINSSKKYINEENYVLPRSCVHPFDYLRANNPAMYEQIKYNPLAASYLIGSKIAVNLAGFAGVGINDGKFELIDTEKTDMDSKMTILTSNGDGTFTETFSGQRVIHASVLRKNQVNNQTMRDTLDTPLAILGGLVCGETTNKKIAERLYLTKGHEEKIIVAMNNKAIKSLENLGMIVNEEMKDQNHPQEVEDYFNQIVGYGFSIEDNEKGSR